jgi:DNA-binding MarR family transcriptional regulator
MNARDLALDELLQSAIDRFWETIPPSWNQIRTHLRTIAIENFDITIEQFHILRHIRKGYDSISHLAEARAISRSAASQTVDLLVEKGLVIRRENQEDRRFVFLELSPEGVDLLNKIFAKNRLWMQARLAGLTPQELESAILGMQILKRAFDPDLSLR